jgi:hypothetical protein
MSRSASSSYKGYTYQRARLLHLIFCEYYSSNNEQLNSISFCEENLEDIDISITDINGNTEIHLYQEKYLSSDENESLNKDSGLVKVLISHYNNTEITKINYEVVSTSGNIDETLKLKNFKKLIYDNYNNHLIGKFIVLNFCDGNKFKNTNYDDMIELLLCEMMDNDNTYFDNLIDNKIKFTYSQNQTTQKTLTKEEQENINMNKLNNFCHYCNDENNITDLIIYLKKLNIKINNDNTFDKIHNKTLAKIKTILPEFNEMCCRMSNQYNNFYSETLYGLFEMLIVKNLFQTNDKMTIRQLIDNIKDKIANSITNDDRLTIVIYTIKHFIRENKSPIIKNTLYQNDNLALFMINNKMTITKFIREFDKENIDVNNINIRDIIRKITRSVCELKNYNFLDDDKLLGFLYRTHKYIKFTGLTYPSLKGIDDLILNT